MKIETRIHRLTAVGAVQDLIGKYVYYNTAAMHDKCLELFSSSPEAGIELPWGTYNGQESLRRLFLGLFPGAEGTPGVMHMYLPCSPVIEVAEDAMSAKGVWNGPGHETYGEDLQAYWAWVKIAGDFVLDDGVWKILYLRLYGMLHSPFETSWVANGANKPTEATRFACGAVISPEFAPDVPGCFEGLYDGKSLPATVPELPPEIKMCGGILNDA